MRCYFQFISRCLMFASVIDIIQRFLKETTGRVIVSDMNGCWCLIEISANSSRKAHQPVHITFLADYLQTRRYCISLKLRCKYPSLICDVHPPIVKDVRMYVGNGAVIPCLQGNLINKLASNLRSCHGRRLKANIILLMPP